MKKKILVPLDGSDFSRKILPYLRNFFSPEDYDVYLLRVAKPPSGAEISPPRSVIIGPGFQPPEYERPLANELSRYGREGEALKTTLQDELLPDVRSLRDAGYGVSVMVHFGNPAREIVDVAEDEAVDLVAMATHGRTGVSHLLMGSVAEEVVHRSSVPVLLVRPQV